MRAHTVTGDPLNEDADSSAKLGTCVAREILPFEHPKKVIFTAGNALNVWCKKTQRRLVQTLATMDMKADLEKKLKYLNNPDSLSHGTHKGLNVTETFLERSDVGREYLGKHLAKGLNYSSRRLIQAITDTFPTGCNKLR